MLVLLEVMVVRAVDLLQIGKVPLTSPPLKERFPSQPIYQICVLRDVVTYLFR